jgi:CheY-like chemotaxis protein
VRGASDASSKRAPTVLRREQRRDPAIADIPVVVLSGADSERAPELAAAAWFDKPVSVPQVISVLRRLCKNS